MLARRYRSVLAMVVLSQSLWLSGCSVSRKLAVGQMVPILQNTAEAAKEVSDLNLIEYALPGNLLLMDGLIRTSPKNRSLLAVASFLQFGYAMGIVEPNDPELAAFYYHKGYQYGIASLEGSKKFRDARDAPLPQFKRALKSLGMKHVEGMAWACANWGKWISLNLESPAVIAQQPRFEALLARLLELDDDFEDGLPHVVRGMYDAMRPVMFGGQPDSSRAHFETAFSMSGRKNKLYLELYAESYCRQTLDEECFDATLEEVLQASDDSEPRLNLMNAIAVRRAKLLLSRREEIF